MKIEQKHIDFVRYRFAEMQTKDDLVSLLSEAKDLLYGEKCKPILLKSLTYYANPELSKKRYTCADKESKLVDELKTGTVVFLYNTDNKSLLGPFTTLSKGDELDAGTWVMEVDENNMPYEDVKVTWED